VRFTVTARDGAARAGLLELKHGQVRTPVFMPVGTQASVKTLCPQDLREVGAEIILGNTFHLYLRPGAALVEKAGGLHGFMAWERPVLTDSGGFQVFSLAPLAKVDDEGVTFSSPFDGSRHRFTPESAVDIQRALGSDILMAFDQCPPHPCTAEALEDAVRRTAAWAKRCKEQWQRVCDPEAQSLFGIVQGGVDSAMRARSAGDLVPLGLPGYAIGGLSVGEPKPLMHEALEATTPLLPEDKPRYLMGVGTPEDLWEGVARGVDMFDCVFPTRIARNGTLFTRHGRLVLKNARYAEDLRPPEEGCSCYTCRNFSRAYLRHLLRCGEILALRLCSLHNLHSMITLARFIRESIEKGRFSEEKKARLALLASRDTD